MERSPFSLTSRKEEIPGLRIDLELDGSGRQLKVTDALIRSVFDPSEGEPYWIEVCLDTDKRIYFKDGEEKLSHISDVCRRILRCVPEMLGFQPDSQE